MARDSLPPLNWLRAFEASARHLSFTRAGEELHMTQSAVSQQIKGLENFLGQALFVRGPRSLQMTETALNYLPTVQEAFATLGAGTRALAGTDRDRALTVRANLGFAVFWLAPRLPGLLARHPWLTLDIAPAIWDSQPRATGAHVEVRLGRALEGPGVERLGEDWCFPVCAPALAAGADWRRDSLFDCAGMLGNWEAWLAGQGESLPRAQRIHLATTYAVSIAAVLGGAGLGMAHDTIAGDLLAQGRLACPFSHRLAMVEAYYLQLPPRHAETAASRAFTDWLREAFAQPAGVRS